MPIRATQPHSRASPTSPRNRPELPDSPRFRPDPCCVPHDPVTRDAGLDMQVITCLLWRGVDVFKALADPTRRTILDELADRDGQTLFELCTRLVMKHGIGSSRQAISQHLDVLEAAGLVRTRREGRYKFHHLEVGPLRQLLERWAIRE